MVSSSRYASFLLPYVIIVRILHFRCTHETVCKGVLERVLGRAGSKARGRTWLSAVISLIATEVVKCRLDLHHMVTYLVVDGNIAHEMFGTMKLDKRAVNDKSH